MTQPLRAALLLLTEAEVDDGELLAFLVEALKGEGGGGVTLGFAEECLSSFFPFRSLPPSELAHALRACIAACYSSGPDGTTTGLKKEESAVGGGGGGGGASIPRLQPAAFPQAIEQHGAVQALGALFPDLCAEALALAVERCGSEAVERVAAWIIDTEAAPGLAAEAAAAQARRQGAALQAAASRRAERSAELASRQAVLAKFDERPEADPQSSCKPVALFSGEAPSHRGAVVRRYVEGQPVMLKPGVKVLVEKPADPPAGTVVALKVKKKGQGGPSPGFK
jgi:hypothetical protein